jgi:hypothetical protein
VSLELIPVKYIHLDQKIGREEKHQEKIINTKNELELL